MLVEAELGHGVVAAPLSKYDTFNTRICRPIGLSPEDRVTSSATSASASVIQYDLKNIIDMMRYFFPNPPVPASWRRRTIALAQASRHGRSVLADRAGVRGVGYPILPEIRAGAIGESRSEEILHIRHHSLYTPRDFDLSPFFAVVKPTIETGFNYKSIQWGRNPAPERDNAE